jgi:hypothetical protein
VCVAVIISAVVVYIIIVLGIFLFLCAKQESTTPFEIALDRKVALGI